VKILMDRNSEIKQAKPSYVPWWLIAERLGVSESSLYRHLRNELPKEKKDEILNIIKNLQKELA
jgi:hypothetical protein